MLIQRWLPELRPLCIIPIVKKIINLYNADDGRD
jgi:hypothetical protein